MCEEGYVGDSCAIQSDVLTIKRQARDSVVNMLENLLAIEDMSQDSVESMITSLVECSQRIKRNYHHLYIAQSLLEISLVSLREPMIQSIFVENQKSILNVIDHIAVATIRYSTNAGNNIYDQYGRCTRI